VVGATPETTRLVSTKYAIMRNCGFVVANAIRIGYPRLRGSIMKTRRTMKKLWNRLFKKNSKSKNLKPPKALKKLVDSIERDDKGRWVIPTEGTKLPRDFTEELKRLKEDLNKASEISIQVTVEKKISKKPTPKKKDTNE
jgi:hypothetical protein